MILRRAQARTFDIPQCHGGPGVLRCTDYLGEAGHPAGSSVLIHDDLLPPGTGIGEHLHSEDEELYIVLEGSGTMVIDGRTEPIGPGDICLTRRGHSHALTNTGTAPMRLLVIGVQPGPPQSSRG
jgi:mannose-6-phosphate isomerase-like protein (cupin superfamily)